jgi:hypothetical protein
MLHVLVEHPCGTRRTTFRSHMFYTKLTRCLRYRIEIDGGCLQSEGRGRNPGPSLPQPARGAGMNTLFQAEESSLSKSKKVAIAIVALAVLGFAVWGGVEMAWRLASGR